MEEKEKIKTRSQNENLESFIGFLISLRYMEADTFRVIPSQITIH